MIGCIMLCQPEAPLKGQRKLFLVEKDYRRYGVGAALTKALMEKAKALGYQELIPWTASPLSDAIPHYEKLGFCRAEEVENHTWNLDGEPLQEVKMIMQLS